MMMMLVSTGMEERQCLYTLFGDDIIGYYENVIRGKQVIGDVNNNIDL